MKLPGLPRRIGSPRLLPIVIFAALALLVFKGVGIVTNGGYVLSGTQTARAADATPATGDGGPSVDNAAPRTEPTMSDNSPTLTDTTPTIATKGTDPAAPAVPAPGPASPATAAGNVATAASPGAAPAAGSPPGVAAEPIHTTSPLAASLTCPPADAAPRPTAAAAPITATGSAAPAAGTAAPAAASPASLADGATVSGCLPDAVPMKVDVNGNKQPLAAADGSSLTQDVILQRLADRRTELDKREASLNMREAIVEAAEKQMADRSDALKALEAQIATLSDQKNSMEDAQFAGLVKMYEAMKPQDAATIFDGLDMTVMLRVAKAMDPRKMSPILARMSSSRAQELTAELATEAPPPNSVASAAPTDPNSLPQIVGH